MGLMCYEGQSGTSRLQKFLPLGMWWSLHGHASCYIDTKAAFLRIRFLFKPLLLWTVLLLPGRAYV